MSTLTRKPSGEQTSEAKSTNSDKYNIPNVLKHIYSLKYLQRSGTDISGTSKEFWMPDDQVKECFECNDTFSFVRRRHVNFNFQFFKIVFILTFILNTIKSIVVFVVKYFAIAVQIMKFLHN